MSSSADPGLTAVMPTFRGFSLNLNVIRYKIKTNVDPAEEQQGLESLLS